MIFYGVNNEFFDLKGDAEKRRKELSLPPTATEKFDIKNAKELVPFLNELMASTGGSSPMDVEPGTGAEIFGDPDDLIGGDEEDERPPAYDPTYLVSDEEKATRKDEAEALRTVAANNDDLI